MPIYKYRARKGPDKVIEDKIEAQTEAEALEKINQIGYLPTHIEEDKPAAFNEVHPAKAAYGRVSFREVTIFSRQLASLIKSGVPILEALNIISGQSENPNLEHILRSIHNAVRAGATFSCALTEYPKAFSSLYVAIIRTGEDSGNLHEALLRISDHRSKQEEVLSRFRMAMAYPILMGVVGVSTVVFMLTFVMPRLKSIFTTMGQNLPIPTRILLSLSSNLRQWWPWIVTILMAAILIVRRQMQTKAGRLSWSILKLHIPIYGSFAVKAELARFCRTMELLIRSGVPILKALDLAIPVLGNEVIKDQLKQSHKELEQGGSFGKSIKGSKTIPPFVSNLIIVGEESGKLHEALSEVAGSYDRDTDEEMRVMTSLLEPIMILTMGLIVGFIVIAMLLPIFEINVMAR